MALILFGGMGLLSLSGMFALDRRAQSRLGKQRWEALAAEAPLIPFAGLMRNAGRLAGIKIWPLAVATLVYLWF